MNLWKNTLVTMVLGTALLGSAGCNGHDHQHGWEGLNATNIRYTDIVTLAPTILPIEVITKVNEAKLSALAYDYDSKSAGFRFLVGPDSRVTFDGPAAYLDLHQGWVFLWGKYPRVRKGRVSAGAEGSAMVMWSGEEGGKPVIRVYFVGGTQAWWQLDLADPTFWTTAGEYMEFKDEVPAATTELPAPGSTAETIQTDIMTWVGAIML